MLAATERVNRFWSKDISEVFGALSENSRDFLELVRGSGLVKDGFKPSLGAVYVCPYLKRAYNNNNNQNPISRLCFILQRLSPLFRVLPGPEPKPQSNPVCVHSQSSKQSSLNKSGFNNPSILEEKRSSPSSAVRNGME